MVRSNYRRITKQLANKLFEVECKPPVEDLNDVDWMAEFGLGQQSSGKNQCSEGETKYWDENGQEKESSPPSTPRRD